MTKTNYILAPNPAREKALQQLKSSWKFRLFLMKNLPAASRAGLRMESVELNKTVVSIPYKRANKNPFRSTYFACLSMAAEMASGALALLASTGTQPSVAMLVVDLEATFLKKAVDTSFFTCEDGPQIFAAVAETLETGEPVTVRALSVGRNPAGEEIARFYVTWSFKSRRKK